MAPLEHAPARASGSIKLPLIAPFATTESIVQALATRDVPMLMAALLAIEKRANSLVAATDAASSSRPSQDPVRDYLAQYPTIDAVFVVWDLAHKTNNSPLSAAVLACLSSLVRLASTNPLPSEPEFLRRLLTQYGAHLDRALNPGRNDVTVAALKLCNLVVAYGSGRFAKRLFGCMSWSTRITSRLFKTRLHDSDRDPLVRPDIRTLLVGLVLALLSSGDSRLKAQVIETKGLLSGMIKGLSEDSTVVIHHVLVTLYRDVVMERSVRLEARRAVFDESAVAEFIKLYDVSKSDFEDSGTSQRLSSPAVSIHRFLLAVTEWLATQINESPHHRSAGPQKTLGGVLKGLKITEDARQRELALHILRRAPILVGAYWARFPASLDPRLSSRWISAITWATQIVSLPVMAHLDTAAAPPTASALMESITSPLLTKVWYSKAVQHDDPLVSFLSAMLLLAVLQKASKVLERVVAISRAREEPNGVGKWGALARELREGIEAILPDPQIVVALSQTADRVATASALSIRPKHKKQRLANADSNVSEPVTASDAFSDAPVVASPSARHLRIGVTLRVLWLYHRVAPTLISTLRFDFAKLPHAHVLRSDVEGARAITSAYALRLSALHSATLVWSRPGELFKTTLMPLFRLYRASSTPSNHELLVAILSRLMSTPLLFGDNLDEVGVWLAALPRTTVGATGDDVNSALDFFEACVQKTLNTPPKPAGGAEAATMSPLLRTVLFAIREILDRAESTTQPVLTLFRFVFFGYLGAFPSLDSTKNMVEALMDIVSDSNGDVTSAISTIRVMQHSMALLEGKSLSGDVDGASPDKAMADDLTLRSPLTSNLFSTGLHLGAAVQSRLSTLPVSILLLHARPLDLVDPTIRTLLARVLHASRSWVSAAQILLHRLAGWAPQSDALASAIEFVYRDCPDDSLRRRVKSRLFGSGKLQSVFAQMRRTETIESTFRLVSTVLSPANLLDSQLAQPFCQAVLASVSDEALRQRGTNKRTFADAAPLAMASAPIVPFFDEASLLRLVGALLELAQDVPSPDATLWVTLRAALDRTCRLPPSPKLHDLWVTHFSTLLALARQLPPMHESKALLLQGAELLPFSVATGGDLTNFGPQSFSDTVWRRLVAGWTEALLDTGVSDPDLALVVAALVYRSSDARRVFTTWLQTHKQVCLEVSAPLRALLEVSAATKVQPSLPDQIVRDWTQRLLSDTGSMPEATLSDTVYAIESACRSSSAARASIKHILEDALPTLERDAFTRSMIRLVSALARWTPGFVDTLSDFVNSAFDGLVRQFVENDTDDDRVELLVLELCEHLSPISAWLEFGAEQSLGPTVRAAQAHRGSIVLRTHRLDPLITAIIARRLGQNNNTRLAATLCASNQWKDHDISRHLNAVLANPRFRQRARHDEVEAILQLVLALARSSLPAAVSCRLVDRLIAFYGGTKRARDRALLELFQRLELVGGASITAASKLWNPASDPATLETTRVAALGHVDSSSMRQCWISACVSIATPEQDDDGSGTYDPEFMLPFVAHTVLEDELGGADWGLLLESGALGVALVSLASPSPSARSLARATLRSALVKSEGLAFREKEELALILRHARNCIHSANNEPIPSIIALFLACCAQTLGNPASSLYPAFMRFLLQRAVIDQRDVPMFYAALFTSGESPDQDRRWLIRFLADGMARTQDWRIVRRRQTFELLASLFQSSRQDRQTRKRVLQFLVRATAIPRVARELVARNGLLAWIVAQQAIDDGERCLLIDMLANVLGTTSFGGNPQIVAETLDAWLLTSLASDQFAHKTSAVLRAVDSILKQALSCEASPSISATLTRMVLLLSSVCKPSQSAALPRRGPLLVAKALFAHRTTEAMRASGSEQQLLSMARQGGPKGWSTALQAFPSLSESVVV